MTAIAVVFDFDDTLVPDSTSSFLQNRGVDAEEFWSRLVPPLIEEGYDPPLAHLRLILDQIGGDKPLGTLSDDDLIRFGQTLDYQFFPGLPQLFDDLRHAVRDFRDVTIEFFIVSGGLQDVIGGNETVRNQFDGWYACQLGEDNYGVIRYIKRCVTFTEKTRYLFEISKGIRTEESRTKLHLVNRKVENRRIPFKHMIYIGDGLTDIPCFSLIRNGGGLTFGVLSKKKSAKQSFQELPSERRVDSLHSPDYRAEGDLGALIRAAVSSLAAKIDLDAEQA